MYVFPLSYVSVMVPDISHMYVFPLSYVSAMVPVKTMKEYDMLQEVTVLFSETVHRYASL